MSDDPVMAVLARIEDAQVRMEAHLDGIDDRLLGIDDRLQSMRGDFMAELGKMRADIMEGLDRVQIVLDDIGERLKP